MTRVVEARTAALPLWRYRIARIVTVWILLGLFANLPWAVGRDDVTQVAVGALGLIHSIVYFWRDGGQRITAPGIFLVSTGLFAFFPAVYMNYYDGLSHGPIDYVTAVNLVYWWQVAVFHFVWEPRRSADARVVSDADDGIARWGMGFGFVLFLLGVVGSTLEFMISVGLDDGASCAGLVLFAVSAFRRQRRASWLSYAIVLLGFFVYVEFVFAGFGRLQIGALGLALAMAMAHRWHGRTVKTAMIAAFPPVLLYLAASRVQFTAGINPGQSDAVNGLESVVGPFMRFAELVQLDRLGDVMYTWGHSFFAAAVAFVPRALWPDKPEGFGRELAMFFSPHLAGTGHSEAALFFGEWLFAFGLGGIAAMAGAVSVVVLWLDRSLIYMNSIHVERRGDLLRISALMLLSASLTDLVWGGAFSYVTRVGPRLMSLALVIPFTWRSRRQGRESS